MNKWFTILISALILLIIAIAFSFLTCNEEHFSVENRVDTIAYDAPEPYVNKTDKPSFDYHQIKTTDDCRLYVKEAGSGTPIVFLHGGWGQEHSYLAEYFLRHFNLSDDYRLIFYDQRGSIRSPCNEIEDVTVKNHVEDIERIRKELALDSFKIVAHSMGTYLAFEYIESYKENVTDLLAIGPLALEGNLMGNMEKRKELRSNILESESLKEILNKRGLSIENRSEYSRKKRSVLNHIVMAAANIHDLSKWRCVKGAFSHDQKIAQQTAFTMGRWLDHGIWLFDFLRLRVFKKGWDFTGTMNEIQFNPVFITGSEDYINKLGGGLISSLNKTSNGKVYYLEKAGHATWIDRPETVKNIIKNRWLKD